MLRRQFLQSLAAAPFAAYGAPFALAQNAPRTPTQPQPTPTAPAQLDVVSRTLDVNGKAARVFGLTRADGRTGLDCEAGSDFDVSLVNRIDEPTLVHWHGLTPPPIHDGVPDNPMPMLRPGETRRHTFPLLEGGTHWMHAHTLQEQNLLAAPLIVRTAQDRAADMQDVVVMLHDFSFKPASELLAHLSSEGGHAMTGGDGMRGGPGRGGPGMGGPGMGGPGMMMGPGMRGGMMGPGMMRGGMMGMMHPNDIEYDAYLANDRTLDDPDVVRIEKNGRVRLRIINGASATAFTIDMGALEAEAIAVDGQPIRPVRARFFPISMGQRVDIRVFTPREGGAFPVLALREGATERAGLILATAGASIEKIPVKGDQSGPLVGLEFESMLRPVQPLAFREANRGVVVTLMGGMQGYNWGMATSAPLQTRYGERVEIGIRNMSMMAHPMHLHGHRFQVVAINGQRFEGAVRDTVVVPPMARVVIAFDANNAGRWPFHCHHLYHMTSGMMDHVAYDGIG